MRLSSAGKKSYGAKRLISRFGGSSRCIYHCERQRPKGCTRVGGPLAGVVGWWKRGERG